MNIARFKQHNTQRAERKCKHKNVTDYMKDAAEIC